MLARSLKMTLVGDANTGKLSLAHAFIRMGSPTDAPGSTAPPTVGEDEELYTFVSESLERTVNTMRVTVTLATTSRSEALETMRAEAYKGADVFLLCYSAVDRTTLDSAVKTWAAELKKLAPRTPILLVGTKLDAVQKKLSQRPASQGRSTRHAVVVDDKEARAAASKVKAAATAVVSARTGEGVSRLFADALQHGSVHRMRVTATETRAKARRGTMGLIERLLAPKENAERLGLRLVDAAERGDEGAVRELLATKGANAAWAPPDT